ncbi:LPXTG cell wall anchor domain-containing protein [Streptomyces sp. NBC_00704]|uniref:LPXTG cell wall anchor domain-containing protein n=1 Tax=Streptomyces sp. NBC_00704 TaxID=2975809 RepID=UPI002E2F4D63|nr:LPXTG cell wall anchor domain-containing protein [Streptomyces sp. NBC_00704]
MKLRRTMVALAATAVVAPLALLSAPAAFAEDDQTSSASASASESTSSSPSESDGESASGTPTDDTSASSSAGSDDSQATGSPSGSPSGSASSSASSSASASGSSSASASASASTDPFDPYTDCESFELDEKLTAQIKGLPSKIVAGSGWHDFEFVVDNDSAKDLKNVYIDAFMEYGEETDTLLSEGLAVIQVKEDGKWTSGYQDSYEDGHGKKIVSGSFVALLDSLEKNSSASLDLRVKVEAAAPAGSSFALSEAVYAGQASTCYGNGDFYDVEIVAAGGHADGAGDAKPNGDKPTDGVQAQGGAKPISGTLASTGSDSALPVIGLVGGVAVVAGAGAVFAARRRKAGAHA